MSKIRRCSKLMFARKPLVAVLAAALAGGVLMPLPGAAAAAHRTVSGKHTLHGSKNPECWVRGFATLDTVTGSLKITLQLETDSVLAGPIGRVTVVVKDANGKAMAKVVSPTCKIGGKPPGRAIKQDFVGSAKLPKELAARAKSLDVKAEYLGPNRDFWSLSTIVPIVKFLISIL